MVDTGFGTQGWSYLIKFKISNKGMIKLSWFRSMNLYYYKRRSYGQKFLVSDTVNKLR